MKLNHYYKSFCRFLLTISLCLAVVPTIQAQNQILPADAKEGTLRSNTFPTMTLDGNLVRLSPGSRLYDLQNRLVLPGLWPSDTKVKYILDEHGAIKKAWMISKSTSQN